MTDRVKKRLNELWNMEYRKVRDMEPAPDLKESQTERGVSAMMAPVEAFCCAMERETPVLHEGDTIGFYRSCGKLPRYVKVKGRANNITPDYEAVLAEGLNGFRIRIRARYEAADEIAREFYDAALICLAAAEDLVVRYREAAREKGDMELYENLCVVPLNGARNYHQALITMKFVQFMLRINQNDHITIGRFDQYMKPYFDLSRAAGVSDEELLEQTEMFFLSLNFDSDLYYGVQKGDNGQSMVLGGCDKDGNDAFNDLSEICLQASEELKLIDPKINLRVNPRTPLSVYERGTRLTKQGLGFPQYSNDDKVIPGLIALGYSPEDAWNYSVAACWEPIIPAYGMDVPNIAAMDFPKVVRCATVDFLAECADYASFRQKVKECLEAECEMHFAEKNNRGPRTPEALLSLFLRPCIEVGRDVSQNGARYNNYGIHGVGIAPAADAMEAIERAVFLDRIVTAEEFVLAIEQDFAGYEDLQKKLLAYPKMGNNEDSVDEKALFLMGVFSAKINNAPNDRGGIWRAGTGSAMEYLKQAGRLGATADGRNAGQPYGANYSIAFTTRPNGPLSAVQSFTKYELENIINGGPYTMEIHDTVFRNAEGEKKVAMLVKTYIDLGGHQIQINAVNRDTLLDAQKHPEKYPNLIVRVWGWSGYFNELELPYQEHIIRRTEFTF